MTSRGVAVNDPTFGGPEQAAVRPLWQPALAIEATPPHGLAFRCGLCGAVLDASAATIAEVAAAIYDHMRAVHGLGRDDVDQAFSQVVRSR